MLQVTNQYGHLYYESIEFTLNNGQTNYDLDSQQSGFLAKFGPGNVVGQYPTEAIIRTDQTITVKFNNTSNDSITVTATDSPFVWHGEIVNIYLTNASGNNAAVKILIS